MRRRVVGQYVPRFEIKRDVRRKAGTKPCVQSLGLVLEAFALQGYNQAFKGRKERKLSPDQFPVNFLHCKPRLISRDCEAEVTDGHLGGVSACVACSVNVVFAMERQ